MVAQEPNPKKNNRLTGRKLSMKTCKPVLIKTYKSMLCVVSFALLFTAAATAADNTIPGKHKIITFEVPGAGTGSGEGTLPISINPSEAITGLTRDANEVRHGFLRDKHGKITVFDDVDAGTGSSQGTRGYSINPKGEITGYYTDSNDVDHGYVRAPSGTIKNFDAPDAGTGSGQGTFPWGSDDINPSGAVTGFYVDSNNDDHGFLRDPHGKIIEFDAPGGAGGTAGFGINPAGAITGDDCSATNCYGFLRSPKGHFTRFGVRGAVNGTYPEYINAAGWITGTWTDASGADHGFVRDPHGKITKFDPSGAGTGSGQGTIPWSINNEGVISGQYQDASGVYHGFVRAPDGKIKTYDISGAGTGSAEGTQPSVINDHGAITGDYIDASGVLVGFLAQGLSYLEYSDLLPEASVTFDDLGTKIVLGATTAPRPTTRRPRATLPE
jgi:hypothetical protein